MTTSELARKVLPHARAAVKSSRGLGPLGKLAVLPFLPILVRIGVELAVLLFAPGALPVVDLLIKLLESSRLQGADFQDSARLLPTLRFFRVDITPPSSGLLTESMVGAADPEHS